MYVTCLAAAMLGLDVNKENFATLHALLTAVERKLAAQFIEQGVFFVFLWCKRFDEVHNVQLQGMR